MLPRISYVIFGVQRSGTTLLCECLKRTGLAGVPEEYFLSSKYGGPWTKMQGEEATRDFIEQVFTKGATPNGVFGINIMWNYFDEVVEKLHEIPEYSVLPLDLLLKKLFPNLHYIWMIRRDKVRQAVSWAKAAQTGIYASYQLERQKPKQKPIFDFNLLDNLHQLILEGEAGWEDYFRQSSIEPHKIYYEDLAVSLEAETFEVIELLGLTVPKGLKIDNLPIIKQADEINEEWVQKYNDMRKAEQKPGEIRGASPYPSG